MKRSWTRPIELLTFSQSLSELYSSEAKLANWFDIESWTYAATPPPMFLCLSCASCILDAWKDLQHPSTTGRGKWLGTHVSVSSIMLDFTVARSSRINSLSLRLWMFQRWILQRMRWLCAFISPTPQLLLRMNLLLHSIEICNQAMIFKKGSQTLLPEIEQKRLRFSACLHKVSCDPSHMVLPLKLIWHGSLILVSRSEHRIKKYAGDLHVLGIISSTVSMSMREVGKLRLSIGKGKLRVVNGGEFRIPNHRTRSSRWVIHRL